jgi:hypothetical protein
LLRKIAPRLIWYPCQWPETYSYTLSQVLKGGYPLIVPDIGALKDRVSKRPFTRCEEYPLTSQAWLDRIISFCEEMDKASAGSYQWVDQPVVEPFYKTKFLGTRVLPLVEYTLSPEDLSKYLKPVNQQALFIERVLYLLFLIRSMPGFRSLSRLIPVKVQRKVKRLLSRKPMHEL